MSAVADLAAALKAACLTVSEIRVYEDLGGAVDPPAVVIGPPTLGWDTTSAEPSSARFSLYLVAAATDRALERLWALLPLVAAAVDAVPGAVVKTASPGFYQAGGVELPSYTVTVEAT